MNAITVEKVSKTFSFKTHRGLKGFLRPEKKSVVAVDAISFTVQKGDSLAFIGPNGAGKSTTIKMLTGILQPTSGELKVLGLHPLHQRRELAMQIGTVFGQRSQLVFNLPLTESLLLAAKMYRVPDAVAKERIATLTHQFELQEFIDQPVRKLSLGQRMRAEVANALIHNPSIIFLDEPTIGLDIVAKRSLREVIKKINKEQGTTVFLTSHDVGDIEELCERTIIVNHGQIMLDAQTSALKRDYLRTKTVAVVPSQPVSMPVKVAGITATEREGRLIFAVDTSQQELSGFLQQLLSKLEIADLLVEDTPLEDIIHELYTRSRHEE